MALTESNTLDIGMKAFPFSLFDVTDNQSKQLDELKGEKGTMIMFICAHCPYVIHVESELANIAKKYQSKGIAFIAISSNDVANYPDDSPEKLREQAIKVGFTFPYLYDETQEIAKKYDAACTPDFYVFDQELRLFYHGRLDESTPGNKKPITGSDIKNSLDALLENSTPPKTQWPSMGCNIKWKK